MSDAQITAGIFILLEALSENRQRGAESDQPCRVKLRSHARLGPHKPLPSQPRMTPSTNTSYTVPARGQAQRSYEARLRDSLPVFECTRRGVAGVKLFAQCIESSTNMAERIIIIGSGPAAWTCA